VQAQILNLIKDLKSKYGMAVILITHDLTVVKQFADRVYVMQHGEVKEHNNTAALFSNPHHPYTKRLLASEPQGVAKALEGNPPTILSGKDLRMTYTLKRGGLFNATYTDLHAVDGLSLELKKGETLGLVGESGSGKTTFGQALIRLLNPQAGEIIFDGNRIDGLNRDELRPFRSRMQIVFQDPFSSMNPRMNVGQIIEEGMIVNQLGGNAAERLQRVQQALEDAGMPTNILSRFPHEFSGGQRQRIAIARAIALEPEFILLDEPTSALDLSVQAQIIELLRKLQRERGLSYLFISHDLKVVRALCHRVIVLQHGKIVEQGLVADVLTKPKSEYTKRLVRAAFEIAA
jgi:peptide/nickel transport system ATP-binding protein